MYGKENFIFQSSITIQPLHDSIAVQIKILQKTKRTLTQGY